VEVPAQKPMWLRVTPPSWSSSFARQQQGMIPRRFCYLYQRWRSKLAVVLRQEHKAGEKMFVDWAGDTIPVQDRHTGEVWQASLFVAALGASSNHALKDWLTMRETPCIDGNCFLLLFRPEQLRLCFPLTPWLKRWIVRQREPR
jgi:transposase